MGKMKELYITGIELGFSDREIGSPAVTRTLIDLERQRRARDSMARDLESARMRYAAEVAALNHELVALNARLVTAALESHETQRLRDELSECRHELGELQLENAILRDRLLKRDESN